MTAIMQGTSINRQQGWGGLQAEWKQPGEPVHLFPLFGGLPLYAGDLLEIKIYPTLSKAQGSPLFGEI